MKHRTGTCFHDFRFTCDDISFEDAIPRWLTIREEAETACNVFVGMQYARPGYTETRLLLSAITAEGFHAGRGAVDEDEARSHTGSLGACLSLCP